MALVGGGKGPGGCRFKFEGSRTRSHIFSGFAALKTIRSRLQNYGNYHGQVCDNSHEFSQIRSPIVRLRYIYSSSKIYVSVLLGVPGGRGGEVSSLCCMYENWRDQHLQDVLVQPQNVSRTHDLATPLGTGRRVEIATCSLPKAAALSHVDMANSVCLVFPCLYSDTYYDVNNKLKNPTFLNPAFN